MSISASRLVTVVQAPGGSNPAKPPGRVVATK